MEDMVFSASKQPPSVPPKPPDDGGGGENRWKISFASKVMGQQASCAPRIKGLDTTQPPLSTVERESGKETNEDPKKESMRDVPGILKSQSRMFVVANEDYMHGDWMLIDRKKLNRRAHAQGGNKQDFKKGYSTNPFSHLSAHDSWDLEVSRAVFNSGVSPTKEPPSRRKWVRKRARNNEVKIHKPKLNL
ncbi:hypothetical protein RIF29_38294 [Crotalaria pallida]|uniref:Uncharacterized protein n=1 Tax=Crotalaria pallida TaxID=3830 RepID=A0AAN9HNT2_CROPI